jgi:hypothetical protein
MAERHCVRTFGDLDDCTIRNGERHGRHPEVITIVALLPEDCTDQA